MKVTQDEKWAEWIEDEEFYSEIRQMVKARLREGQSKDDIRRLLQDTTTVANGPTLVTNSPYSSRPSPILYRTNPREDASATPFAFDTIHAASHYAEPPTYSPTTLFPPYLHYVSNPSSLQPSESDPPGLPLEKDLPPAEFDPNFSDATTQMDLWTPSMLPQHSFSNPYLFQTQLPPSNAYFDPSEPFDSESQQWYQTN